MTEQKPLVGIVLGSPSDWPLMQNTAKTLESFGVPYEVRVLSAHRTPDEALNGTTALHAVALMKGASILRVHDVKEAVHTVTLIENCKS